MELSIISNEVIADIRSAAWLEQELHSGLDRHRRHQMADICEAGNDDRVWRILALKVAEIRREGSRIFHQEKENPSTNSLLRPEAWRFRFLFPFPPSSVGIVRERIHEYLVAAVMADRTEVIVPEASAIWRERAAAALAGIRVLGATLRPPFSPVRRPIWPC
ncbi:MAG: hypothetical protein K2L11_01810 [Muribaculaceae bacterium]|nr:hypothetical protein [Muribaculaceae bacterium]